MINFDYETDFIIEQESLFTDWLREVIEAENCTLGEINYVFCDDDYLHKIKLN